ncbi:MAG: hypothetical protein WCJ54_09205 [Actinomycetota bacterium]
MKKILFITSDNSAGWAFQNEIEILGKRYQCYIVSSLSKAFTILQQGVNKVVMYPFYIAWHNYEIKSHSSNEDLRNLAGYYFWKQELEAKKIPTIVVDLEMQVREYMEEIEKKDWKNNPDVTFFYHDGRYKNSQKLAELIKT